MSKESILGSLGVLVVLAFFTIPLVENPDATVPVLLLGAIALLFFGPAIAAAHFLRSATQPGLASRRWADLATGIGCMLLIFTPEIVVSEYHPKLIRDVFPVSGVLRVFVGLAGIACLALAIASRRDLGASAIRILFAVLLLGLGLIAAIGMIFANDPKDT